MDQHIQFKVSDINNIHSYDLSKSYKVVKPWGKSIQITSPSAGVQLKVSSPTTISWSSVKVDKVNVYSSVNSGKSFSVIASAFSGNSLTWTVPDVVTDSCLIKVQDYYYPEVSDTIDLPLSIIPCRRIYVSTTGNDITGDGSISAPFATIQKAVNEYIAYDSIKVATGLYTGTIDFEQFNGHCIRIDGSYDPNTWNKSAQRTILENPGGIVFSDQSFLTAQVQYYLDDMIIRNSNYGIYFKKDDGCLFLNKLEFINCSTAGYIYRTSHRMNQLLVRRCTNGFVFDQYTFHESIITNSIFDSITGDAIFITRYSTSNHYVNHCDFNRCGRGIAGTIAYPYMLLFVKNSILMNNGKGIDYGSESVNPNTIEHNLFFNNSKNLVLNNINQTPVLSNVIDTPTGLYGTGAGFYKLLDTSPCIGAGVVTSSNFDFANNPRPSPINSNPDIGIFENQLSIPTKTLLSNVFLEGLYNKESDNLNQAYNEFGPQYAAGIADEVRVELHNLFNYNLIEYACSNVKLSTNGDFNVPTIPGNLNGSYFIAIKHRNSLETVSSIPVPFTQNVVNYSFNDSSKVFGNNLKSISNRVCIYSGDLNQDGRIDSVDMASLEILTSNFGTGYVPEDINGDGTTDSKDMILIDNNASSFIHSIIPDNLQLPIIETTLPYNILQTSILSGGNVISAGSYPITTRGVCW
ncbi:hypothetical protein HXX01_03240, partial [Candidatus Nomurabacteria bacterium]|nr:hypothetical protein [Candidatus Nomurabacteria bacterium]